MRALQLRKQILLLQSDLNRSRLHSETGQLREAIGWVSPIAKEARRHIAPGAIMLASLAGLAIVLGMRRSKPGGGVLSQVLGFAPPLIQLWRTCVLPSNQSK
jgi:hypothetical protein